MVIVIDLSRKLVGFNLFESFFYKLKSEGNLVFANNPLTVDDEDFNYSDLKAHVQNILFDHHASSYSLCVLYDMEDQKQDPIKCSIASNIHEIKENIIKPLSQEYSFDKLYYFSLDSVKRNYDGIPYDDNIKLAIDYDSQGYISEEIDSKYKDIPILMLTARSQIEDKLIGEETGVNEYITKPFDLDEVVSKVEQYLGA